MRRRPALHFDLDAALDVIPAALDVDDARVEVDMRAESP
jgi:hypothetical protein